VRPDHLFVATQSENCHDRHRKGRTRTGSRPKLTAAQVAEIRARYRPEVWGMQKRLADEFGVKENTINAVVHGHSWKRMWKTISTDELNR
jgi:hypothetical protein